MSCTRAAEPARAGGSPMRFPPFLPSASMPAPARTRRGFRLLGAN